MVERAAPAPTGHFTRRSSSALECHPRYYGLRTQQANGRLGDATLPSFTPRPTHNLTLNLTPTLNPLREVRLRLRLRLRVRPSAPSAFSALSAVKSTAFGDEPRMPSTLLWPTGTTGERSPRRCDPTSFTPHPTHNLTLNPLRLLRVRFRPGTPLPYSSCSLWLNHLRLLPDLPAVVKIRELFAAALGDANHVFNPASADFRVIEPRLHRDDISHL